MSDHTILLSNENNKADSCKGRDGSCKQHTERKANRRVPTTPIFKVTEIRRVSTYTPGDLEWGLRNSKVLKMLSYPD